MTHTTPVPWWKDAVVYQIYPRSFQDSNGDGVGDLRGITARLDYLARLGVDIVWISPIFASPNDDNGYDISDYRAIMPEFGNMDDFDELVREARSRGLKIMLDLVVNHTSDEHPWFVESRSGRNSPKRDWYVWRAPQGGNPPNRWQSYFSGSVWELDEPSGEYYLHLFSRKQPDLNWENPLVRREVYDMMRFWLDKGISGWRMDTINMLSKPQNFPEGHPLPGTDLTDGQPHFLNGPRIHEFLQEMHREVLSHYDVVTVGETPGVTPAEGALYSGEDRNELNMVFHFEHVFIGDDRGERGKWSNEAWTLPELKRIISRWQTELHGRGWNSLYWDNHDQPRAVSRFGHDREFRVESAKMLCTVLLFMQGTPYIYQGQELGMTNVSFQSLDHYRDIETINASRVLRDEHGWDDERILAAVWARGRDNARTPMQWDDSAHAGFTTGTPWIGVNPNFPDINAQEAETDPASVWHHYRETIALRKSLTVVRDGTFTLLDENHSSVFAYVRDDGSTRLLVAGNFSDQPVHYAISDEFIGGAVLSNNYPALDSTRDLQLQPYQAVVLKAR
ncbi:alpha-glucosidase [Deinococcus deserti]|uniref:Putative Oligo-1,6-glucosidase (Oligosaccharide alpha-1,6-glucosidase) (Sucrase-isomaltase) (Isomaltase) (Dextrin 6-alpha-D-glucanohydrolase) n=1 Tax=Deinococcus deserti (strain DSM 17065 / CIP 109153 / LMG 22923 / VCD115) TaxID=546414 RepID=C1CYH8_DEIDV|nr:alpha-glucosidase [Deinococcus deserti]ACO44999.1 putative Oligo-1,6-glucosidase (Oligosaccharide alpha-1,6- glucosidase) (Sucrase-isomaltase) (Isomaltase) (Dextrin 6-alpha-D- glucanohydrolase) [Deinococcus deserti VCD115]